MEKSHEFTQSADVSEVKEWIDEKKLRLLDKINTTGDSLRKGMYELFKNPLNDSGKGLENLKPLKQPTDEEKKKFRDKFGSTDELSDIA